MKKKQVLFVAALLSLVGGVAAADDDETSGDRNFRPQTLVEPGEHYWGAYGSPVVKATSLSGSGAVLFGGRGAVVLNHTLAIGGAGYGLATPVLVTGADGARQHLNFGYGGPTVQVIFLADRLVHFDIGALFAWGGATVGGEKDRESRGVLVLEPEANVELNVTESFRIALGGSYRYVAEPGSLASGIQDLGGFAASLGFRFGRF